MLKLGILNKIKKFLEDNVGPGTTTYSIFKPCRRCVYQKSHEPILIISKTRGPRIIIIPNEKVYVRKGKCIGYKECGKCFEAIEKKDKYPCRWISF